jgi:endonuclease/exonuclease/phosphatase family metal-dependent hydrolase
VNVVVTHLDRSDDRERREQLRVVGNYFLSLAAPAVLMGDLNSDADEPALQFVLKAPDVVDPLRVKLGEATPRRIDWILVRGATTTDAGIIEAGPSDHPYAWAELVIPPAAEAAD